MTGAVPTMNDNFSNYRRWLGPFVWRRAIMVSPLNTREIRTRLRPIFYDPEIRVDAAHSRSVNAAINRGVLKSRPAAEIPRIRSVADSEAFGLIGKSDSHGIEIWTSDRHSHVFRARFAQHDQGTHLDISFGWTGSIDASLLILLLLATQALVIASYFLVDADSLHVIAANHVFVTVLLLVALAHYIRRNWLNRHDFDVYLLFLADWIDARVIDDAS